MLTKTDLRAIGDLVDKKLENRLNPVKRSIKTLENKMIAKFNGVVDNFDDRLMDHEKRIKNLETNFRLQ